MYLYLFTEYKSERLFTLVGCLGFLFFVFFYNPFKRRYRGISQIDCKISDRRNRHYSFLFKIFFYEQHVIIGFALRTLL